MEQEKKEKGRTVTFRDLWNILIQRIWVILLAAMLSTALLFAAVQLTYTPRYESRATLYIMRHSESTTSGDASAEFSLALKLVNDCTYFLKSHMVLDQVITDLDLDLTYNQLYNSVTTHNPDNTRILEVIVEAETAEQAKQIVDHICRIAPQVIEDTMGHQQVQLFEYGRLDTTPCNQMGIVAYILIFAALAVVVYGIFLISYLLDDRIRSDEDVERVLGLSILGNIPDANATRLDRYGCYAYGHKGGEGERK